MSRVSADQGNLSRYVVKSLVVSALPWCPPSEGPTRWAPPPRGRWSRCERRSPVGSGVPDAGLGDGRRNWSEDALAVAFEKRFAQSVDVRRKQRADGSWQFVIRPRLAFRL